MALIECWQCKKEISENATSCPHCGEIIRRTVGQRILTALIIIIVGLCVISIFTLATIESKTVYGPSNQGHKTETPPTDRFDPNQPTTNQPGQSRISSSNPSLPHEDRTETLAEYNAREQKRRDEIMRREQAHYRENERSRFPAVQVSNVSFEYINDTFINNVNNWTDAKLTAEWGKLRGSQVQWWGTVVEVTSSSMSIRHLDTTFTSDVTLYLNKASVNESDLASIPKGSQIIYGGTLSDYGFFLGITVKDGWYQRL